MKVKIKRLNDNAVIPQYATPGAAGFDLHASENRTIFPGETALVPTGLSIEIPNGYEMQVRPRSGVSLKTGLRVANSPGTVDSDYRGEVCIIMHNTGDAGLDIFSGDRIAQGVICPVLQVSFEEVDDLSDTKRGSGGFGSTGGGR